MDKPPPIATDSAGTPWTRAMLLRELRKPIPTYRWEWVGHFLWPMSAICGVISYKGFVSHGWPAVNFGCALLSFNFAVSAIVNRATAPLQRKIDILEVLLDEQSGPADDSASD
jgi:hypothetical protein